ncbi:hypothetical protein MKW92_018958, partial [Papaver armeniacum]
VKWVRMHYNDFSVFTRDQEHLISININGHNHGLVFRSSKTRTLDVPHPWLNLFVPKSRISEFDSQVFLGILGKNKSSAPILVYPTYRNNGLNDLEYWEEQNKEILRFCDKVGIRYKQYLPHYETKLEWENHFGKWVI